MEWLLTASDDRHATARSRVLSAVQPRRLQTFTVHPAAAAAAAAAVNSIPLLCA